MVWALLGTLVSQGLVSIGNLLSLLATLKWHEAIYHAYASN